MCDYSLHAHNNRLAVEGETLVTTRFPGGSMGMVAVNDPALAPQADKKGLCAVCIPPGARLRLEGVPVRLRQEFCVSDSELVTFTQFGLDAYTYRDAVRFANGREVLLQRLNEGQQVRILSLLNAEVQQPAAPVVQTVGRNRGVFASVWELAAFAIMIVLGWFEEVILRRTAQMIEQPVQTPPPATPISSVPKEEEELVGSH